MPSAGASLTSSDSSFCTCSDRGGLRIRALLAPKPALTQAEHERPPTPPCAAAPRSSVAPRNRLGSMGLLQVHAAWLSFKPGSRPNLLPTPGSEHCCHSIQAQRSATPASHTGNARIYSPLESADLHPFLPFPSHRVATDSCQRGGNAGHLCEHDDVVQGPAGLGPRHLLRATDGQSEGERAGEGLGFRKKGLGFRI
jgi:hypothetical protein